MKKLARYLKPFAGTLALALVLLFVQATLDLNLPNLMSNIVNVGIQQGGITEAAPKAVPEGMLQLLEYFMPGEDAAFVEEQYLYAEDLSGEALDSFLEEWPEAASIPTRYLSDEVIENNETFSQLEDTMSRSMYAMVSFLQDMADQTGASSTESTDSEESRSMDPAALEQMAQMLAQLPAEKLQPYIQLAAQMDESMTRQTAPVFIKSFYSQLGADTDAIQTRYILRTGGLMLLLSLGLMACAISVGLCASRAGAGFARDLRSQVFRKVTSFANAEFD